MSRNYSKRTSKTTGGKRMLLTAGVIFLLIMLFFLSFWITSLVLKANQEPLPVSDGGTASPVPTEKPTYEELEKMVIEKEKEIQELKEKLERYQDRDGGSTTGGSVIDRPLSVPSTPKPSASPTQAATKAPTKAPTQAPTPTPTSAPATPAPTQTPTQAPTPTSAPATPAPTQPPADITIQAPAAGGGGETANE